MASPLNRNLYSRLVAAYGTVKIANEGDAFVPGTKFTLTKNGKTIREELNWGEYYMVNCPFCTDTQFRLWVNHMFAVDGEHMHAAVCYNTNCLSDSNNFSTFCWRVASPPAGLQYAVTMSQIKQGVILTPAQMREVKSPGDTTPVGELPGWHKIRQYLEGRGFNCQKLQDRYGVSWCANSSFSMAVDRIIIPIMADGVTVGWQARYPSNDLPQYANFKTPKYYTMPGMKKTHLLYNRDVAFRRKIVTVMEGPTDVWRFGRTGVCLFGKKISATQASLIAARKPEAVVVLLDPAVNVADRKLGLPHHIDAAVSYLANYADLYQRILPVYLPKQHDPGSMPRKLSHAAVVAAAESSTLISKAARAAILEELGVC